MSDEQSFLIDESHILLPGILPAADVPLVAKSNPEPVQSQFLSTAEAARMRSSLTRVYASIGASVGMDLWNETQAELVKIRTKK